MEGKILLEFSSDERHNRVKVFQNFSWVIFFNRMKAYIDHRRIRFQMQLWKTLVPL